MRRFKRIIALMLVFALIVSMMSADVAAMTTSKGSNIFTVTLDNVKVQQSKARSMLDAVNEFRTGDEAWAYDESENKVYYDNLCKLEYDYNLEKEAMNRLGEIMVEFDHGSAGKGTYWFANSNGITASGENICCCGYSTTGYDTVTQAMNLFKETSSTYLYQGHRRAMLNSTYKRAGFACGEYNGRMYWVQLFGYDTLYEQVPGKKTYREVTADYGTKTDSIDKTISLTASACQTGSVRTSVFTSTEKTVKMECNSSSDIPDFIGTLTCNSNPSMKTVCPNVKCSNITWTVPDGITVKDDQIISDKAGTYYLKATVYNTDLTVKVVVGDTSNETQKEENEQGNTEDSTVTESVTTKDHQTVQVTSKDKTVSYSKLKKKNISCSPICKVEGNKGTLTYKKTKGSSKITVNSKTGKVTVKKKTKKGTYLVFVKVTAKATSTCDSVSRYTHFKIKVK